MYCFGCPRLSPYDNNGCGCRQQRTHCCKGSLKSPSRLLLTAVDGLNTEELCARAQLFLDTEKLVVLGDTIRTAG